jgi:hypothetical protein
MWRYCVLIIRKLEFTSENGDWTWFNHQNTGTSWIKNPPVWPRTSCSWRMWPSKIWVAFQILEAPNSLGAAHAPVRFFSMHPQWNITPSRQDSWGEASLSCHSEPVQLSLFETVLPRPQVFGSCWHGQHDPKKRAFLPA